MADEKSTVLSVRTDTEEKKRFEEFVATEGKNNKDFLNTLLNLYELNKGKAKNINLVGDIETLEGYTSKIQQAFVNIIDKLEIQKGDIVENSQKDLQIYKDKVNDLQNKNDTLKSINSTNEEMLTSVNNVLLTLQGQNKSLTESLQDKLTIINEYQNKIDVLSGIIEEYKGYKPQIEEYKKLLTDAQTKHIDLSNSIKDKDFSISGFNKDIVKFKADHEELKIKHAAVVEALKQDSKKELEQSKRENELNIKLAVADVKEDLNIKLLEQQEKHNLEVQEYQSKYKELLDQMDQERSVSKTKTTGKKINTVTGAVEEVTK